MHGDLSRVANGFRCRICDGTIQEAALGEDLKVEGETCGCVKSFCYIGDTLDGNGADLAATSRIRNVISDIQSSPTGDESSSVCL